MKIAMRLTVAALLAIAVTTAFAQGVDDNAFKQKVSDAAGKYKSGNSTGALTDFMALNGENANSADVNSWIGFIHLRNGEFKKAVPYLEHAKQLRPRDKEVLNNLGNAYMQDGQKARALSTYKELIALDDSQFQAYYNMGNILREDKKFAAAEEAYKHALSLAKNSPQVLNNLGVAQEEEGKLEDAYKSFKGASEMKPREATYARNAGAMAYRLKQYENAITYLKRAMDVTKQDNKTILALADSYSKTHHSKEMMDLYDKYRDAFEGDFNYFFNVGVMKKDAGDLSGAEESFRTANKLNPKDGDTRQNIGALLFKKRDYSHSREFFEAFPGDGGVSMTLAGKRNLAAAASRMGDFRTAMPIWSEILKQNSGDQEVRLLLADAIFDSGDMKSSMSMYVELSHARPDSAAALDGIGRCHLRQNQYAAAEASFRSAIKAEKGFVPAYNNLAVVLEKENKRREAIGYLEMAASMDGNNADVQKNLKRMRSAG